MTHATNLLAKTCFGFLQLVVILGALLFGSARTWDYWQAWIFLCVFVSSCSLVTAYLWKKDRKLLERRMKAGPRAEKEFSQKVIMALFYLVFAAELVLPSQDHRYSSSNLPVTVVALGDVLVALGFLIIFFVFRENTFTSATIELAPDQKVISTGPYAIVRHPMYFGGLVLLFGIPMALGSAWGNLMNIAVVVSLVLRILNEEKFLNAKLTGYPQFVRKVKYRLVPFIW